MDIDGIKVTVTGDPYPGEIESYVRRGQREHGKRLTAMEITLDGVDCDIVYILRRPFERIRRSWAPPTALTTPSERRSTTG